MITSQDMLVPFNCPRCGGPMHKPAGSSFYWHATNNHSPCSITNVAADVFATTPASDDASNERLKPKGWQQEEKKP